MLRDKSSPSKKERLNLEASLRVPVRTQPRSPGKGSQSEQPLRQTNARVEQLEGELARLKVEKQCLEVRAAGHRVDFERERERCDTLVTEALKLGNLAMSAREKDWTVSCRRPGPVVVGGGGSCKRGHARRNRA